MTEEDEVDILGDSSLDSFLSKSETLFDAPSSSDLLKCDDSILVSQNSDLLKCDYTIHPQWLLDKPSTNPACWYSSVDAPLNSDVSIQSEIPQMSSENSISDESGWTEKEKDLLYRGIEIFGKSNVRLSQFIGSKSASEVKYYLKNFYSELQSVGNQVSFDYTQETVVLSENANSNKEILDDAEIPASIEEVISVVSTAKPTVTFNNKNKATKLKVNYDNIPSGHSLLKKNFLKEPSEKAHLQSQKQKLKNTTKKNSKHKNIKFKFKKTKIKLPRDKVEKEIIPKQGRRNKIEADSTMNLKTSDIEIVTGNGLSVPVCNGEEVIKIKKASDMSDSDVEIDIIDSEDETQPKNSENMKENNAEKRTEPSTKTEAITKETLSEDRSSSLSNQKKFPDLTELSEADVAFLKSTELPKKEYTFIMDKISDLEKYMHSEFFEGRSTKTPMRYLKIRNHILNAWKDGKPTYVMKTSIRQGLKQCGDVNCIGRIHQFLEQIGAINFKCPQTSYIRPLYELVLAANNTVKEKSKENYNALPPHKFDMYYRNRNKKKYVHDGEGGCTLQHNESGDIINTTVVNEDPVIKRPYVKRPIIRLMYCKPFNNEHIQEYKVIISLEVILLMDLHAHASLSEVMGLVGGHWNEKTQILTITRYEPCKNVASSLTHCEMCPITQAKAADVLHEENLNILGWFHSHPTFAPEPSQQDIDTQLFVQRWIGYGKPCIGVILSPFSSHGALIASPYRCMVVDKKENCEDQFIPYKLQTDINSSNVCVGDLMSYARTIFNYQSDGSQSRVDFNKAYFQDTSITFMEKFLSSIKMHLAKCSGISKMTCDAIMQGFTDICTNQ